MGHTDPLLLLQHVRTGTVRGRTTDILAKNDLGTGACGVLSFPSHQSSMIASFATNLLHVRSPKTPVMLLPRYIAGYFTIL